VATELRSPTLPKETVDLPFPTVRKRKQVDNGTEPDYPDAALLSPSLVLRFHMGISWFLSQTGCILFSLLTLPKPTWNGVASCSGLLSFSVVLCLCLVLFWLFVFFLSEVFLVLVGLVTRQGFFKSGRCPPWVLFCTNNLSINL